MSNIVYILTNEAMPDLVKIGKTDRELNIRVQEISRQTGVPLPFEIYFACEVDNMDIVESSLHDAFLDHRINPRKEFFRINPERIVSVLKLLQKEDITPKYDLLEDEQEKNAINIAKERRARFNFKFVDIAVGSELRFYYDENIICSVASDREVLYADETTSLNQLTLKLLKDTGRVWKSVQGPAFWMYEGESLDDRRRRLESE